MVLPIPNLDDRRFDELSKEGRERVLRHLPELTQIAPGDPAHAMVDLFAYLTENVLYRMNLIPERQRRAVMNLLQIPLRMAVPSKGVVCIDSGMNSVALPALVHEGAQLKAGSIAFTSFGELQPTPLSLAVMVKRKLRSDELNSMGVSLQELRDQYGIKHNDTPQPFEPRNFVLGQETLSLAESLDQMFYLAFLLPKKIVKRRSELIENLAGITLNVALVPADELDAQDISSLSARRLSWEFLSRDEEGKLLALPLEVLSDSSRGGRKTGVVRLRLPNNTALYNSLEPKDPMFAGLGSEPPELPDNLKLPEPQDADDPDTNGLVAFWLRLSCEEEPLLSFDYLGVNGVDIRGQGLKADLMIGVGTGNPNQIVKLPDNNIDPDSLVLQVEEGNAWTTWQRVDFLSGLGADAEVYRLDASSGHVYFGDGLEGGKRPQAGRRIRIASYLHGGGELTNVIAGDIKELVNNTGRLIVRHEWRSSGGLNAESVTQAEKRIPQFLTHRNRAVTSQDFKILAQNNPVNPVAKAQVVEGFMPGNSIKALREGVPGVISIFVIPPRQPALRQTPKPSKGLLKDVFEYLKQRMMIGVELYVLSPEYRALAVGVKVQVIDPETEQQTLQAVEKTIVNFLWPLQPGGALGEGWDQGVAVRASEIATQVARVPGVKAVNDVSIFSRTQLTSSETGHWRRHQDNEVLSLEKYQLPELLGVSASTGSGKAGLPKGVDSIEDNASGVPAPVIPDVC